MVNVDQSVIDRFNNDCVQVAEIIATSKDGQTRTITEANIVQGGLKIDRYSVTGSKIEIGSAVAAELSLKLRNYDGEFDDFSFEGADLYVKIGVKGIKSSTVTADDGTLGNFILGESLLGQSNTTTDDNDESIGTVTLGTSMLGSSAMVAAYGARNSTAAENVLGNFVLGTSMLGADSSTGDADDRSDIIWMSCGRFIVDTPPRKLSTITLSALDYMVKFDKDVDTSKLSFPCHVDNLISQLCTVCGVTLATDVSNFPNHFFSVSGLPANNADSLTYRQLLQWCAMLTGTCGFVDDEGQLVLKWYEQTSVMVTPSERYTSDMLENDITVTGFTYKDSDNNTYVAGTAEYPLDISDCGFLTNSYVAALRELNKARGGFSYRPYSATIKAAPYLFPLDMIWYRDKSGTIHQTVVTNVTFGLNCNTSISGAGETTTSSSYSQANGGMTNQQATANRETNDKIDAVDKKLDEASKDFSDFRIEYSSDFQQLQDSIEARVTKDTYYVDMDGVSERIASAETNIKQNADDITLRATKTEAKGYANTAESNAKSYSDAQIKVSADEIKLGVAKTSHDPLNYAQLNKDTAAAWGFTAADEADGVWYTLKTLKRDTAISDTFSCEGGEKLRVQGTISTTVKGNSSSGGTDSVYRNCSIMVQCCDATYKNYSWSASTSVSNSTQKIDSTITIPTNARYFNIFVHVESWGNFSGAIKVKNIEVSKVGALDARLTKAETSITQTANDITLRATKTEAQGYANTAESNAKKYSDSQLKITSDSITTKVSTAQGTADAAKTAAATAQSTANTAKTNAATAQSDVNALKTRVTNAETSIKQTANDITLKASKTEVSDAKKEAIDTAAKDATTKANTAQTNAVNAVTKYTDAQIQTLAGEINLKASQKSVNDLSGRVDSAVASINVNAGAIEMKASKTEAQGYANKAESNAKTAAASDATTKANNAKTAAINAAATDATNKANAAEKNAKNELYSMMTFTADNGLVITHSGWSGKVQITGQNIQVIRGNNKVIVNDNGISITDGTSSCSIGTSGVSITDSKGSVNINSGSLTFKGVKNNVELFKNDATTYAAQTYTVDLSRYAAILVTFRSNKGGTWFAGGGNAGLVSMIVPVNGVEMSMVYPWNTVHKRSITAYTDKIVFGTGYQRTSRYSLGVVNYFDLETPWSDDWKTDNTKCVPYKIYGFL